MQNIFSLILAFVTPMYFSVARVDIPFLSDSADEVGGVSTPQFYCIALKMSLMIHRFDLHPDSM